MMRCRQRRKKQMGRRKRREKACVFKRVRTVNGCMCLQEMYRKSASRATDSDVSMIIRVYVPASQRSFRFDIPDDQVRAFLMEATSAKVNLSNNEIMEKRNLALVCDRLMCRIIEGQPIIYISRRTIGERGIQVARKGVNISGHRVVVTCFWSNDEVVFQTYDTRNCGPLRCSITMMVLRDWLQSEQAWEKRRAKRLLEGQRCEARKYLKLHRLGVEVEEHNVDWAMDFLAANGGDEEFGIEAEKTDEELAAEKAALEAATLEEEFTDDEGDDLGVAGFGSGARRDQAGEVRTLRRTQRPEDHEAAVRAVKDEANAKPNMEEDITNEIGEDHPLMRPERKNDLVEWLMARLRIAKLKQGHQRGRDLLMLQYELDKDAQNEAAARIQGLWRMRMARERVRQLTHQLYEKRYSRDEACWYYVFLPTETMQWTRPKTLEQRDYVEELDDPEDKWREHLDAEDNLMYINPFTGQFSWMSPDAAATVLQKRVREHLAAEIGKPTIQQIVKALKIQQDAEEKFKNYPNRLSSIVNYAMLLHTQRHDLDEARKLYKRAMEISPENPVLLRAYALFVLCSCEAPRSLSWTRSMDMLRAAELRDPDRDKFRVSEESFFHWAVVCAPKNPRTLLNYALLNQCVAKDYELAEKFYRRALAQAPEDPFVVRNYQDFELQRLPGGMYAGGGPPASALKTSVLHLSDPDWAEWQVMRNERATDPRFETFWLNSLSKATQWVEPDWNEVWEARLKRAVLLNDFGIWREYQDPALNLPFFFHPVELKYQSKNPFGASSAVLAAFGGKEDPPPEDAAALVVAEEQYPQEPSPHQHADEWAAASLDGDRSLGGDY